MVSAAAHASGCKEGPETYERAQFGLGLGLSIGGVASATLGEFGIVQVRDSQWDLSLTPSGRSTGARAASDVLLYGALAATGGYAIYASVRCRGEFQLVRARFNPALELVWPWLWTIGISGMTKSWSGRPRPNVDGPNDPSAGPDDFRSFFSGHAAIGAVLVSSTLSSGLRFVPRAAPPGRRALISAGAGLVYGTGMGALRVAAGRHHWSDVITGTVVGTGIGLLPIAAERFGAGRASEITFAPWLARPGGTVSARF